MPASDRALSESVSIILVICLIVILAIVVAAMFFGNLTLQKKTAYIAGNISTEKISGKTILTFYHMAGDPADINRTGQASYTLAVYVDTLSGTNKTRPMSREIVLNPGTKIYVFNTTGGFRVTTNAADITAATALSVDACPRRLRIVDETDPRSVILIKQMDFPCVPTGPTPTVTAITNTTGYRGWMVIESITGTNFLNGATAKFNRTGYTDIPATACSYTSSTRMNCSFNLYERSAATYNVVVTNPDGKQGMRANYFTLSSPAPAYSASTNTTGYQATTVVVLNLTGNYFQPSTTFTYRQGSYSLPLTGVTVRSPTSVTGSIVIPSNAPSGSYNLTMMNTDNGNSTRTGAFTVNSNAPTVTGLSNRTGYRGWPVIESITGTNFVAGSTARFNAQGMATISADSCSFVSSTRIICVFDLLNKQNSTTNQYNITVINPDSKTGWLANYFTLASPAPTITSSTPAGGTRGTTVAITNLAGNYFQPGAVVTYWRGPPSAPLTSVSLGSVTVPTRTQITGSLDIPAGAVTGTYNITVLNTDGQSVVRTNAFTVYANPPPTITGINPVQGQRGVLVTPVVVTGTNFQAGARVRLYNGTTQIYLAPVGTVTATQITTSFTVPATTIPNQSHVRVTNPDGQYAILPFAYRVYA